MSVSIAITSFGMINPVGIGALASAAAVRAGINVYADSSAESQLGEPIKMACVPAECLPAEDDLVVSRDEAIYKKCIQLALPAFQELIEDAEFKSAVPLFLSLPEVRVDAPESEFEPILKDLNNALDIQLDMLTSKTYRMGRAGGMYALKEAISLLANTETEKVIVGGIDTFADAKLLQQLDQEGRMLGESSSDGFVPGEGAAFLLLQKTSDIPDATKGLKGSTWIGMPTVAEEPGHIYSDTVCTGEGLTSVLSNCLASLGGPVGTTLCSMNGEASQVKEWSFALNRNINYFENGIDIEHPAECFGDLGAATVVTLMILAHIGLSKSYFQSPALLWSASDHSQRGAVYLAHIAEGA